MATLEKIRSKSTLLLIVVGLALFLFIIMGSERVFASFFGPGTTVAEVDGHKVDIQEFQHRVEQRSQQMQGRQVDQADIQAQVLNEMVAEALMDEELSKLGITVTDEELTNFMFGDGAKLADQQVAQMTGGQIPSAQMLYDAAFNPSKYGMEPQQAAQMQQAWTEFEKTVEKNLLQQKFMMLLNGALVANELDAKALFDENTKVSHIAFAKQDYSTLDNKDYTVTEEEVKAEWQRTKNRYKIMDETRSVSYISVDLQPSASDNAAAQSKVNDAVKLLQESGAQGLADKSEFVVSTQTLARNKINNPKLKSYLDSMQVGAAGVAIHEGDNYLLTKLINKTSGIDSINIDFLAVQGKAQLDSLLAGLSSGSITFDDAKKNAAVSGAQDSLWVSPLDPQIDQALKGRLLAATTGTFFTTDTVATAQGGRIFRVNSRKAEVPVYEFVTAQYTVTPSNATVNNAFNELNKFITANTNAADFKANAAAAHYTVQEGKLTPSSTKIGSFRDSRNAVKWAMQEAKKGQVSPIFGDEETGRYIVVAVDDIYDGFIPYNDPTVYAEIENKLRNGKKGDALVAKYSGKASDIAGYAKLMNTQVDSTQVTFGQRMIPKFASSEPMLSASVANAQVNKVVSPVKGNQGVVAFVVTSVDESSTPYNYQDAAARYSQMRGGQAVMQYLPQVLMGRNKVKNNMLHFFK